MSTGVVVKIGSAVWTDKRIRSTGLEEWIIRNFVVYGQVVGLHMSSSRVGFLGGTFNPIHSGHLQLAEFAGEEYGLGRIVFIPVAQPPHKDKTNLVPFKHRVAMLELVVSKRSDLECNTVEQTLPKPSYTIDTLTMLSGRYSDSAELFFIVGADAFLDIVTWKLYRQVLRLVHIIISPRKGYLGAQLIKVLQGLGYAPNGNIWHGGDGYKNIFILDRSPIGMSSSKIRIMINKGEKVQDFMPRVVAAYIEAHKLYIGDNVKVKNTPPVQLL